MRTPKNVNAEIAYCRHLIESYYPNWANNFDYKSLADYINGGETNAELRQIVRDHISELATEKAAK